jgi:hypothetical protein
VEALSDRVHEDPGPDARGRSRINPRHAWACSTQRCAGKKIGRSRDHLAECEAHHTSKNFSPARVNDASCGDPAPSGA